MSLNMLACVNASKACVKEYMVFHLANKTGKWPVLCNNVSAYVSSSMLQRKTATRVFSQTLYFLVYS
jgi:hypothetical protein